MPGSKEGGERVHGGFQLGEHWIEPAANEIDGKRVDGKSIDVLVALAEAVPRVLSVAALLERVWSGTVVVDNVVHQAIAKLRKALGDSARAPRYIQSIPNRGYRLIAEVRMGPQPVTPPARERSIAVLPFLNMSSDIEQAYFSDGISEELLTLLSRIPKLRVPSRSTVFSYKGRDVKLSEVARELNVSHVLEGSVRKSGDRVRVTAQLIDAVTDTHLWSETYDRRFEDIFSIQDEIAATIAQQLKVKLFNKAPTVVKTNPDAYEMFLQARQLIYQANAQNLAESVTLLERVLALDPNYAPAWAELGWNYRNQTDAKLMREHEGYPRARAALERALQLDPDIPQAHAHLGSIARTYEGNLAVAARHLERAISLDSSQLGFIADAGLLMRSLGRLDAAIELQEYVIARDPAFRFVPRSLGASYVDAGRWDEGIASFRAMRGLRADVQLLDYRIAMALLLKGDIKGARAVVERDSDPVGRLLGTCLVRHALGEASASRVALDTVIEQHGEAWSFHIASMLAFRGEADGSFEWLAKTAQHYRVDLSFITTDRLLRNLHRDVRWLPLLESIGKSPAQLSAVEFKVVLP